MIEVNTELNVLVSLTLCCQAAYDASIHAVQSQAGARSLAEPPTAARPLRCAGECLVCWTIRVGIT